MLYICIYMIAGPGCSSVGYGAASELGPLRVSTFAAGLEFNKFAWNKGATISVALVLNMIIAT
jgi:serine carboxypeptidase-like clade 2